MFINLSTFVIVICKFNCRYALGGYDGKEMVSSLEIFDPRAGAWMTGEPMNQQRGYAAAAVLKDSMYIIGGLDCRENIVETVSFNAGS